MNNQEILLVQQCGSLGNTIRYTKNSDGSKIVKLNETTTFSKSLTQLLIDFARKVFLPYGYPDSVSNDYLEYQIWDTVQAFCSTITGTFTTQAILKGVGVGNADAAPLAAAITWIMKDGTGMIGRIVFASWKGNHLDADCKKWRLFADLLNDGAMFIELLLPYFGTYSLQILCTTTTMKAMVGVAGGSTRASITQHQAIKGNMADVSAKDGSQETCVNLIASVVGIVLLALLHGKFEWYVFAAFTVIHLWANYHAVGSLVFTNLNDARLNLVLQTYLKLDTVLNPQIMNKKESVLIGFGLKIKNVCGYDIKLGTSLEKLSNVISTSDLKQYIELYKNKNYLLIPNIKTRTIYVAIKKGEKSEDLLTAYFHSVMLGIALCYYNSAHLNLETKRQLHHVNPVIRLYSAMKTVEKNTDTEEKIFPFEVLKTFNDFVAQEVIMFFTALKFNGWSIDTHSLNVGEWRSEWTYLDEFHGLKKEN